jgi:hypothetical protein
MRTTHNRKTTTKVLELFSSKRKELRKVTFLKERDPSLTQKVISLGAHNLNLMLFMDFFTNGRATLPL